jgi:hypothetical protein
LAPGPREALGARAAADIRRTLDPKITAAEISQRVRDVHPSKREENAAT